MAVNVYAGQATAIAFALTSGRDKTPIDASPLSRAVLQLYNRKTLALVTTLDSNVDANVFFWNRTQQTVKGVSIFLFEMELGNSSIPIQEDMIARLTFYDGANPLGVTWKQFALNSR